MARGGSNDLPRNECVNHNAKKGVHRLDEGRQPVRAIMFRDRTGDVSIGANAGDEQLTLRESLPVTSQCRGPRKHGCAQKRLPGPQRHAT
jgi:hypothetical protein